MLDEAHSIKDRASSTAKAVFRLDSKYKYVQPYMPRALHLGPLSPHEHGSPGSDDKLLCARALKMPGVVPSTLRPLLIPQMLITSEPDAPHMDAPHMLRMRLSLACLP